MFRKGTLFNNRYEIISSITKHVNGKTYLSIDKQTNKEVVLKILAFSEIKVWKELELFEREINVLQNLNHPNIPKYIDHFKIETEENSFYDHVQAYKKILKNKLLSVNETLRIEIYFLSNLQF